MRSGGDRAFILITLIVAAALFLLAHPHGTANTVAAAVGSVIAGMLAGIIGAAWIHYH